MSYEVTVMRAVLLAIFLLGPSAAFADFTGRVVKVSDGDTLTVLVNKAQIRVRLESIDAPESKQAFGKRSQQSLAELCGAKTAIVRDTGKDRFGRTLGWVGCDGVDANTEQIRRGLALSLCEVCAAQVKQVIHKKLSASLWIANDSASSPDIS